ncbi:MAG: EamA family transporter [Fimbriimonadaceae bacterium]|nr:EamA family transporter [Chitinophagales bacterium]
MNADQKRAYLILHICVFIWGFTAILGNLISLQETVLVWYRMGITSVSLLFIPALWSNIKNVPKKEILKIAGIGVLVALHWITFYGAIKYSVVSVALTALATTSFFTSFIEPLFMKTKIKFWEVLSGAAIIPAIYLIFYFTGEYKIGFILGLLSALLAAIFSVLNKKMIAKHHAVPITFIELSCGFIFLCVSMPVYFQIFEDVTLLPTQKDWFYLCILSVLCTTIPFILSLNSLRHLSAFTSNITINLEPVYGILLASAIFKDHKNLHTGFYFGAGIILLIVFLNPLINKYFNKRNPVN